MVGIVVCYALIGGVAADANFTESDIEVMARRYRIQAYYNFRDERAELDRRIITADVLYGQLTELDEEQRQQVAQWFHDAITAGENGQTALSEPPVAAEKVRLALKEYQTTPDEYQPQTVVTTNSTVNSQTTEIRDSDTNSFSSNTSTDEPSWDVYPSDSTGQADANRLASDLESETNQASGAKRKGSVFRSLGRIIVGRAMGSRRAEARFNDIAAELETVDETASETTAEIDETEWDVAETEEDSASETQPVAIPRNEIAFPVPPSPKPEVTDNEFSTTQLPKNITGRNVKNEVQLLYSAIANVNEIDSDQAVELLLKAIDIGEQPNAGDAADGLIYEVRDLVAGVKFDGSMQERTRLLRQIDSFLAE